MAKNHDRNFEAADVLRMFPTFVWRAELEPEIHQRVDEIVVGTLEQARLSLPELAPSQAWQSEQDLHDLDELQELVGYLNDTVGDVLKFLKVGYGSFEITACWANMNATGAGHKMHSHPNNFLSGIYYVRTQEGADTINFHDPRPQTGILRPPVTDLTAENTDQVVVKIKNGTVLLFPSWLPHSVDANSSREVRISLSFNVMLSSHAKELSKPRW
jgi:uncharacterized protein (TIGR02466 family)